MRHDVDATTLQKAKVAVVGAVVALAVAAPAAPVVQNTGKMLHDCCSQWNRPVR
jgi:hypothetical protein